MFLQAPLNGWQSRHGMHFFDRRLIAGRDPLIRVVVENQRAASSRDVETKGVKLTHSTEIQDGVWFSSCSSASVRAARRRDAGPANTQSPKTRILDVAARFWEEGMLGTSYVVPLYPSSHGNSCAPQSPLDGQIACLLGRSIIHHLSAN
jgi:hypothetical protein